MSNENFVSELLIIMGKIIQCNYCHKDVYKTPSIIRRAKLLFCNKSCSASYYNSKRLLKGKMIRCPICDKEVYKLPSRIKEKNFCSKSCSTIFYSPYKNIHSRSKLEIWLEEKIKLEFPTIEIKFNDRKTIGAELDIFIPSLKLAIEINGIYHYEPIRGEDLLEKTKNRDTRKFQLCLQYGIELAIFDTSKMGTFNEKVGEPYFKLIRGIISRKLNRQIIC